MHSSSSLLTCLAKFYNANEENVVWFMPKFLQIVVWVFYSSLSLLLPGFVFQGGMSYIISYIPHNYWPNSYLPIFLFTFIISSSIHCKILNGVSKFVCNFNLFCRYVVRAKAGKKQSSKDASDKTVHSAGASLRLHKEHSLINVLLIKTILLCLLVLLYFHFTKYFICFVFWN